MKVFVSINGLTCGGAEKSLISFLNEIPESYIEKNNLELDLLVLDKRDYFFTNVPKWVNWLQTDQYIDGIFESFGNVFKDFDSLTALAKKLYAKLLIRFKQTKDATTVQHLWKCWDTVISEQKKEYDLAISYVDGFSNYYVMDKVNARKKILWVHNEYEKLDYNKSFDEKYFSAADAIVTISDRCVHSLERVFPAIKGKIFMIPNISSQRIILEMSDEKIDEDFSSDHVLVSIGRLNNQKGFDLAIEAAELLSKDIDFNWYILGEGELREELESSIVSKGLTGKVVLLGNRANPYPYIRKATAFIQPSRYEGKSIALDEAKILEKPIVATNYDTVYDSIKNGVNGSIVEFDAVKLAEAIKKLVEDEKLRDTYRSNLRIENQESSDEIYMYLNLFDNVLSQ